MLLNFGDWQFDVDMTATMAYSAQEAAEQCDCAFCRNYYAALSTDLRETLASFGIDAQAPDELMPYDFQGVMQYDGYYAVSGRILRFGKLPISTGDASILPCVGDDLHIHTGCREPYFFLNVSVTLPWVLEEPMEEVISPANTPSFLKRMTERLLRKLRGDSIKA